MNQPQTEAWTVEEEDAGERLDKYLAVIFDEYSRVFLQKMIKEGHVRVKRAGAFLTKIKVGETLNANDQIEFDVPPEEEASELKAEKLDLPILFEDEHILVINKPAGLVVHPGAGIHEGTLANALLGYDEESFRDMAGDGRPGIVHRLDKETSGVIIVAKNRVAKEKLNASFANRRVDKLYLALVRGHIRISIGTLETYIGRSKDNRLKMRSYEEEGDGKEAVTHYKVLAHNKGASLVKVKIETGRTHQIRVHMSEMGFPVIGDKIYGNKRLEMKDSPERQILHAWKLKIEHPITKEPMVFTAPLPEDFLEILDKFDIAVSE